MNGMMEPARGFPTFVLVTSAVVLGVTLVSQYLGGLAPCELCLLERWPWGVAIVTSFVATMVGSRPALPWVALLVSAVFAVSSGLPLADPLACYSRASVARHST